MEILRINRKLHTSSNRNICTTSLLFSFYSISLLFDKSFYRELTKQAKLYIKSGAATKLNILRSKMLWIFAAENFTPYEYRCYGFWGINKQNRMKFIPEESLKWSYKTNKELNKLPRNKYSRYKLFANMFNRRIICLLNECSEEAERLYVDFQTKFSEAIFKPLKGAQGKGVKKLSIQGVDYATLRKKIGNGDYMMEEVIQQGEELAIFHPSSINTIRYVTAMSPEGKYTVLYSMMRCGGGGSVVDNVGSGGYIMIINESGKIVTDAMRGGEYYERHPDTGVLFKGYQIPSWSELQHLAESAHKTFPEQRLLGWDFAWTNKGWDLVEVNPGPAVVSYQILKKEGLRPLFIDAGIL